MVADCVWPIYRLLLDMVVVRLAEFSLVLLYCFGLVWVGLIVVVSYYACVYLYVGLGCRCVGWLAFALLVVLCFICI